LHDILYHPYGELIDHIEIVFDDVFLKGIIIVKNNLF